jgi:hypothetical protein
MVQMTNYFMEHAFKKSIFKNELLNIQQLKK